MEPMKELAIIKTGTSFRRYYQTINQSYQNVFKKYLMLHYPFYVKRGETLEKRQVNLTDYCISQIGGVENKKVLDVGCGNGTQGIYIFEAYGPLEIIGVDLNPDNVKLALSQKGDRDRVLFYEDDAHTLKAIKDHSIDILICIESAFHYPRKELFLNQVERVLRPGGKFLIADIVSKSYKKRKLIKEWKNKMSYHHWTEAQYKQSFSKTALEVCASENITHLIIKGYKGYRGWIKRNGCDTFFKYLVLQIFMFIQVNLNLLLLKRRRKYMIFTGVSKKVGHAKEKLVSPLVEKETMGAK